MDNFDREHPNFMGAVDSEYAVILDVIRKNKHDLNATIHDLNKNYYHKNHDENNPKFNTVAELLEHAYYIEQFMSSHMIKRCKTFYKKEFDLINEAYRN